MNQEALLELNDRKKFYSGVLNELQLEKYYQAIPTVFRSKEKRREFLQ